MSDIKRPLIRYHGGKYLLAKWIVAQFPEHRLYVEPYGGGGSVLFRKPRAYMEVYNDLDTELVNLFAVVRDHGDLLREKLSLTPYSRVEFEKSYEKTECPIELARRTVVKSFMGFGGSAIHATSARAAGFRNSATNGKSTRTSVAMEWRSYPNELEKIIERLRGVLIENREAKKVMLSYDSPETLHYVDPPYVPSTRTSCHGYKHEMSLQDHQELADFLFNLKGTVVLSGYENDLYDQRLIGWKKISKKALADGARKRTEILWINQ